MAAEQETFLDYCRVVWRAAWWIIGIALLASAAAWAYGKSQPKWYVAKVTFFPPRSPSASPATAAGAVAGGGQVNIGGFTVSIPGAGAGDVDRFATLMRSRRIDDELYAEFAKHSGLPAKSLVRSLSLEVPRDRQVLMSISVEARDPNVAAQFANFAVEYMEHVLARQSDRVLELQEKAYAVQLAQAEQDYRTAQQAVLRFQQENRILAADIKGGGGGASLRGAIMALELQREILRMRFTDQHPDVREINRRIAETKKQYSMDLYGEAMDLPAESPSVRGQRKEFFVAAARMTPLQFAYLKVQRNLSMYESFYYGAIEGLIQLRYTSQLGKPVIEVVDPAMPPGIHARPDIQMLMTVAATSSVVGGILLAFVLDNVSRARAAARRRRRIDAAALSSNGEAYPGPRHAAPESVRNGDLDIAPATLGEMDAGREVGARVTRRSGGA